MSLRELVTDSSCSTDVVGGASSSRGNPLSQLASAVLDARPGMAERSGGRDIGQSRAEYRSLLLDDLRTPIGPLTAILDVRSQNAELDSAENVGEHLEAERLAKDFYAAAPEMRIGLPKVVPQAPALPRYFPPFSLASFSRLPPPDANAVTARFEAAFANASPSFYNRSGHMPFSSSLRSQVAMLPMPQLGAALDQRDISSRGIAQTSQPDRVTNAQHESNTEPASLELSKDSIREAKQNASSSRGDLEGHVEYMDYLSGDSSNADASCLAASKVGVQNANETWESNFAEFSISEHARAISESMTERTESEMHRSRFKEFADALAKLDGSTEWTEKQEFPVAGEYSSQIEETLKSAWNDHSAQLDEAVADDWGKELSNFGKAIERDLVESREQDDAPERLLESTFADSYHSDLFDYLGRDPASVAYEFRQSNQFASLPTVDALAEGKRLRQEGHLSRAVLAFESAVVSLERAHGREQAEAWFLLGTTHAECDDDVRAIQAFVKCLNCEQAGENERQSSGAKMHCFTPHALLALGVCYTNELNTSKALSYLCEWLDMRESEREGASNMATSSLAKATDLDSIWDEDGDALLTEHRRLLMRMQRNARDNPLDVDLSIALGVLHNLSREYDLAADALRTAVAFRPDDARLWNKLGATLANGNDSDDALRAYRKAVDLSPSYIRAWVNVGTAYANRAEYDKAARYYLKALSIHDSQSARGSNSETFASIGDRRRGSNCKDMTHVWGYLRTTLVAMQREDLLPFVEYADVEKFRQFLVF